MLAERAVLVDLGVLTDPHAAGMLSPSMAALRRLVAGHPGRIPTLPVTLAGLAGRVLWHDAQVVAAIDAGIDQVVVVGAGYDSRAWRLAGAGVRSFELDHAATQQDKARRAPRPHPTFVAADLTTESAAAALVDGGLDPARPALHIVEGVSMYLAEEVVRARLAELAEAGAPGSRLSIDFYPSAGDTGGRALRRQRGAQRLARSGSGEGLRLLVDAAPAATLVEETGWSVVEVVGMRSAAQALVPPGSGLPVDAVDERKTLVAARRA